MTTLNFKVDGKTVSKTFRSNKELIKYCESEIRKYEAKEKKLAKYPELRARIQEEKRDFERMIVFFQKQDDSKRTYRDDRTGETYTIEERGIL